MAFLDTEHIRKSFGETEVLQDISFHMEQKTVLSIIGSSGSGKTTLLRCLNFLETPDEGIIRLNGEELFNGREQQKFSEAEVRAKRMHFGLVFQDFNLFPQYTAIENVMLAPKLLGTYGDQKAIEENAKRLLADMGLENRMDNYPHQLSGGQKQRVAIARALALSPDILCFDEPTSALDPELTGEVLRVIRELAKQDTTMIIVTHEMEFARDVSDYIIFMDNGHIEEEGTSEEVFYHPRSARTRQFLSSYKDEA
ncbi:MAG: amino acid ABC transporter ATP-binding protein [Solobacterium sp.]|nr:amino acid ABC transporter ATP-binding protein [Solobacterium sp.]